MACDCQLDRGMVANRPKMDVHRYPVSVQTRNTADQLQEANMHGWKRCYFLEYMIVAQFSYPKPCKGECISLTCEYSACAWVLQHTRFFVS